MRSYLDVKIPSNIEIVVASDVLDAYNLINCSPVDIKEWTRKQVAGGIYVCETHKLALNPNKVCLITFETDEECNHTIDTGDEVVRNVALDEAQFRDLLAS